MAVTVWYLIVGALLIAMALAGSLVRRLPLSTALLYLAVGFALGPHAFGLLDLNPLTYPELLERLTEVAVIVSLFSAGLKLRVAWRDRGWLLAVRLAFVSMAVTVGLIAAVGVLLLGLPVGAAVLLGAVLAPTDPVLASDVAVAEPGDRDRVRFALTGEAGFNDGTAFPFVMLGLGLLGLHDLGFFGLRWLAVDLVWAVVAGLAVGGLLGALVGRLVLYLRLRHREAVGLDDFLALGLIALAYGVALLVHAYGFLAVFAAGLALRRVERRERGEDAPPTVKAVGQEAEAEHLATDPDAAPAYMAQAALQFNEQLERLATVLLMLVIGSLLAPGFLPLAAIWFVPLLFFAIRPLAVAIGLAGAPVEPVQRRLIAWFGIRGIGSVYYLSFAIANGLPAPLAAQLAGLTLVVVAASVVVHGVSVTPLMGWYERRMAGRRGDRAIVPSSATE